MATDDSRPPVIGYPAPPQGSYSNGYPLIHAYPHAAPPPQSSDSHYQTNIPPYPQSAFRRNLLIVPVAFFLVTCAIIFILLLLARPQLPEFRVDSVAVTNFSATDSQHVSGTWRIGFHITNPNMIMNISYGTLNAALLYKLEFIADTRISPFDQDSQNETALETTISVAGAYVSESAVSGINSDRDRGSVPFRVRIFAWVRVHNKWWHDRTSLLRVWCDDLAVGLTSSSNGAVNLVAAARECSSSFRF